MLKLKKNEIRSLYSLIVYCFDQEEKHYRQSGRPETHIFRDIKILHDIVVRYKRDEQTLAAIRAEIRAHRKRKS